MQQGAIETAPAHRLATVKEAAAHLQLGERTIRRLCEAGRLPAEKFGRQYRIDLARIKPGAGTPAE